MEGVVVVERMEGLVTALVVGKLLESLENLLKGVAGKLLEVGDRVDFLVEVLEETLPW